VKKAGQHREDHAAALSGQALEPPNEQLITPPGDPNHSRAQTMTEQSPGAATLGTGLGFEVGQAPPECDVIVDVEAEVYYDQAHGAARRFQVQLV
jgi:hypothetical protein